MLDDDWLRLERPRDITKARHKLGLSLGQLAEALELKGGIDAGETVRFWERGKQIPSGPVRVAIRLMLERDGLI